MGKRFLIFSYSQRNVIERSKQTDSSYLRKYSMKATNFTSKNSNKICLNIKLANFKNKNKKGTKIEW